MSNVNKYIDKIQKNMEDCVRRSYLIPRRHQIAFSRSFLISDHKGATAVHGLGTGKTLTAVLTSQCYLDMFPNRKVFIITPASNLNGFINELFRYFGGVPISVIEKDTGKKVNILQWREKYKEAIEKLQDPRYNFFSYEKYVRSGVKCVNSLLIIDEAHNLRGNWGTKAEEEFNQTTQKKQNTGNKTIFGAVRPRVITQQCAQHADKILLLTATPMVNGTYDFEKLKSLMEGREPIKKADFWRLINDGGYRQYFECQLSFFSDTNDEDFPLRKEKLIPILLSKREQEELINLGNIQKAHEASDEMQEIFGTTSINQHGDEVEKSYNSYLNVMRRATNKNSLTELSSKIRWVIMRIIYKYNHEKEEFETNSKGEYIYNLDLNEKTIIYSGFRDYGIKLIKDILERKVKYKDLEIFDNYGVSVIIGGMSGDQKTHEQDLYNAGTNRIILISKAGAEGINLFETTNMILVEPIWNDAGVEQIIGRAIRFRSHVNLPKEKRQVNVYKLLTIFDSDRELMEKIKSGKFDALAFVEAVRESRKIERDTRQEILNKLEKQQMIKDKVPVKERKTFQFDDRIKTNLIQEAINIAEDLQIESEKKGAEKRASVNLTRRNPDLWLYILSKSKALEIDKFTSVLNKIPQLEQCKVSKVVEIDLMLEMERDRIGKPPTAQQSAKIILENMKNVVKNIDNMPVTKVQASGFINDLDDYLKSLRKTKKEKTHEKQQQMFFTPEVDAKKLVKLSGIGKEFSEMDKILEPSAGVGSLVKEILRQKPFVQITAVEFVPFNSEQLIKLVENNKLEEVVNVEGSTNFMKYISGDMFDYVIMNPPFNIENALYDIDFVMRAFGMLKVGGTLVAITSKRWLMSKNKLDIDKFKFAREWWKNLKNKDVEIKLGVKWKGEHPVGINGDIISTGKMDLLFIKIKKSENEIIGDATLLKSIVGGNDEPYQHGLLKDKTISKITEVKIKSASISPKQIKTVSKKIKEEKLTTEFITSELEFLEDNLHSLDRRIEDARTTEEKLKLKEKLKEVEKEIIKHENEKEERIIEFEDENLTNLLSKNSKNLRNLKIELESFGKTKKGSKKDNEKNELLNKIKNQEEKLLSLNRRRNDLYDDNGEINLTTQKKLRKQFNEKERIILI